MEPRFVFLVLLFAFGSAVSTGWADVKGGRHPDDIGDGRVVGHAMNAMVKKMVTVEKEIAEDKDRFLLFALFLREDVPGHWDLFAAAPWISEDKEGSLQYIRSKTQRALSSDRLPRLFHIVLIDESSPVVEALQNAVQVEHGAMEVRNSIFCGVSIKHAFFITCRREKAKQALLTTIRDRPSSYDSSRRRKNSSD